MSSKKKFSHLNWIKKNLIINSCIFTLILAPLPTINDISAQSTSSVGAIGMQAVGAARQMLQMDIDAQKQTYAMMNQINMLRSLRPQNIPDKLLGCPIPQAISAFPEGACEGEPQNDSQVGSYHQFADIADDFIKEYEKALTPGNDRYAPGATCMETKKKGIAKAAQDRINQLTQLASDITKRNQAFRDANKQVLDDIATLNTELHGGQGFKSKDNTATRSKDYSSMFDNNCKMIFNNDRISNINEAIQAEGFLGLRSKLNDTNLQASQFNNQKASYERKINKNISKIRKDIADKGVDVWAQMNSSGLKIPGNIGQTKFAAASEVAKDAINTFALSRKSMLSKINNSGFAENITQDTPPSEAESLVKKKYIRDCVTSNNKGVGIDLNEVYRSFKDTRSRGQGNIERNFQAAISNILSNDKLSMEKKLEEIAALQNMPAYRNIRISHYDANRKIQPNRTPHDFFLEFVGQCEGSYDRDASSKVVQLKKDLQSLQQLKRDFPEDLLSSITEQVMNCGGNDYDASTCSQGSFSPDSTSFCIKHASTCAGKVNQCFNQIKGEVAKREKSIQNKAKIYNQNVVTFVTEQEGFLVQVRETIKAQGEILSRFFPGGDFELPSDMFVKIPPKEEGEYGVGLLGGGTLDFIESLPGKLEKLKGSIKEQQDKIDGEIEKHIAEQIGNIEENKRKWSDLKRSCLDAANSFAQRAMEGAAKQAQQFGEQSQKAGQFCQRFNNLRQLNPAAGCDEVEDLYTEANEISAHLSNSVTPQINKYKKLCASSQNEKEPEEEGSDTPKLLAMCDKHGDWDGVKDEVIDQLSKKDDKGASSSEIRDYLNGNSDELPSKVDKAFARTLKDAKDFLNPDSQGSDDDDDDKKAKPSEILADKLKKEIRGLDDIDGLNLEELQKLAKDPKPSDKTFKDKFKRELKEVKDKAKEILNTKLEKANENLKAAKEKGKVEYYKQQAEKIEKQIAAAKKIFYKIEDIADGTSTDKDEKRKPANFDSDKVCKSIDDEIKQVAQEKCSEGSQSDTAGCIRKEKSELQSKSGFNDLPNAGYLNKKLRRIASAARQEDIDEKNWTSIGQQSHQPCLAAQAHQQRYTTNPYQQMDRAIYEEERRRLMQDQ